MIQTALNIESTPMAPYARLISSMSEKDKVAVVNYITSLISQSQYVANLQGFKRENEITDADLKSLSEKIKQLPRSAKVERLLQLRHKAAECIDLDDDKTRYLLGL